MEGSVPGSGVSVLPLGQSSDMPGPVARETKAAPRRKAGRRAAQTGDFGRLVMFSLGLGVLVLLSKWLLLPYPVSSASELVRWLLRLAVVTSADAGFTTALALFCAFVAWLVSRRPRRRRMWRGITLGVFTVAGWYALASVPMFRAMMVPFTVRLLALAGSPTVMASSIEPYLSPWTVVGLFGVPAWFWFLGFAAERLPWSRLDAPFRAASVVTAVLLVAAYGTLCHAYIDSNWTDPNRWERRIAQSPHAAMLGSCVSELLKDRLFTSSLLFNHGDTSDFDRRGMDAKATAAPAVSEVAIPAASRPRNVVVIVIESLAAGYLDLYGARHPTMPRLSRRVEREGVVFDNAYVQAACSCKSLLALSAGVYPRCDWCYIVRDCPEFDVPTVQEVLKSHGYRTCYLHSGPWSWKQRDQYLRPRGVDALIDAQTLPGPRVSSWGVSDQSMFQAGLDWIEQNQAQPFFLFAYTIETHHPYVGPKPEKDFGVNDPSFNRYLNAVAETDRKIDWFLGKLADRGLAESTLVVITADHGESFGQHNQRVHNFSVYEQAVHIPLVMLHPSLRDEFGLPKRFAPVCQHIDVPPTILDALGIEAPESWQGRSLLAAEKPRRAYFLATGNQIILGLRDGGLKYHFYVETGREELFDLEADPDEMVNLAPENRDRCAQYRRRVAGLVTYQRAFLARHGAR